jgi:hypothetical protein
VRDPELDRILEEWQKADPRDFGQLIRWLTFFARRYEKAKRPADRRFWILQQLDFLSRFGDSLCPGDQLKPVRHLILALMGLDRGVVSPTLMPPYGAYPKPVSEMLFRARMAAAMQMYHESGQKLTGKGRAASLAILHAGTPDIEIGTLENWRQAFLKGDPKPISGKDLAKSPDAERVSDFATTNSGFRAFGGRLQHGSAQLRAISVSVGGKFATTCRVMLRQRG